MARASHLAFGGVCALLFVASVALTIVWTTSMSAMGGMPMPGDWTMSMMWMRMPGQTWPGAAAAFMTMWIVMMVAMMLPSFIPMLQRYRDAVSASAGLRLGSLTALVGVGYFSVWTAIGAIVFPLGMALAEIEMRQPLVSRAVPMAIGAIVLIAGALQLTAWKARQLACCATRPAHEGNRPPRADISAAVRHGVHLGVDCSRACLNLMVILLVVGVMDLSVMAAVTAAITAERLAPAGARAARVIGVIVVSAGLLLIARAAGLA